MKRCASDIHSPSRHHGIHMYALLLQITHEARRAGRVAGPLDTVQHVHDIAGSQEQSTEQLPQLARNLTRVVHVHEKGVLCQQNTCIIGSMLRALQESHPHCSILGIMSMNNINKLLPTNSRKHHIIAADASMQSK